MEPYLAEPWWNPRGNLIPQPRKQTLVEPYLKALEEARGTLLKPWWWNLRGTLPCRTLVEPWWNRRGTLVEPSWNLMSGPPRTTPEPT